MADRLPVTRGRRGTYDLHLGPEERALVSDLLGELRALITDPDPPAAVVRLFPVAYPDDAEQESEYQRLTRDELVASRIAGIETVDAVLRGPGRKVHLDEAGLVAFMQAVNGVRLVLGTLLDVGEDDPDELESLAELDPDTDDDPSGDPGATGPAVVDVPERYLYGYLSWVLDAAVHALSAR